MGRHEANKNELLIESLTPWLRGVVWLKNGPTAEIDEIVAEVVVKALSVARDIESGRLHPPAKPEQYFKQVMRNALMDWFRSQLTPTAFTSEERARLGNELYGIDKDDDAGSFGDWRATRAPAARPPARPRRPFILTLLRPRYWWTNDAADEWERARDLLDAIPSDNRREVVLLNLQGYQHKEIAAQLLRSQQAVSKALQEQYAIWGWKKDKVQLVRYVMAYRNIVRLLARFFDKEEKEEIDGYYVWRWDENLAYGLAVHPFYGFYDHVKSIEDEKAARRTFELPMEEEAYLRSRGFFYDFEPRPGFFPPRPSDEEIDRRRKAQDSMLYRAIMSDPALTPWTDGLELRHMPQFISQMVDYRKEWHWCIGETE